jgi:hypothetical protein
MRLLFLTALLIMSAFVSFAQEAFSPSKAANDPNYLKSFGNPNYNPNAVDLLPAPPIGSVETQELAPELSESAPESVEPPKPIFTKSATFTVVNKRSGKSETFDAQIGVNVISDKLELHPVRCYVQEVNGIKQQAALVEVFGPQNGDTRSLIYSGWLSANYSYATPIMHSQYDVFLQQCIVDVEVDASKSIKQEKSTFKQEVKSKNNQPN